MNCRRYSPEYRAACLAVFNSNIPGSFADDERPRFEASLERGEISYLVIEDADGRVIACGGLAVQGTEGRLCWGMVEDRLHRRGVGTLLLDVRLAMACAAPGVTEVTMDTSHETAAFFARYGFTTIQVLENHYRDGLHRHDMRLALDAPARAGVQQRLDASRAAGHRIDQGIFETFRDR